MGSLEPDLADVSVGTARGTLRRAPVLLMAAMAATCSLAFGSATAFGATDPGTTEPPAAASATEQQPQEAEAPPAPPSTQFESPAAYPLAEGEPQTAAPTAGDDLATAGAPAADASADANQAVAAAASSSQTEPSNRHVGVQLGTPGDAPAVEQANASSAVATAEATVDVEPSLGVPQTPAQAPGAAPTSGNAADNAAPPAKVTPADPPTAVAQQSSAAATATQDGPSNTNVTVRIGSPGDNGSVTQGNSATAAADAQAKTKTPAKPAKDTQTNVSGSLPPKADEHAVAKASARAAQETPSNTNVAVRVGSPGDDGQVAQTNTAAATAATAPGNANAHGGNPNANANASQNGAKNTNVAVRVDSPGTSAPAQQSSTATSTALVGNVPPASDAAADTGLAPAGAENAQISSISSDGNTDLLVDVDGEGLADPLAENGEFAAWIWKWTWTSTEDLAAKLDANAPVGDPGTWEWDVATGDDIAEATDAALAPGDWLWNWSWERPGDWAWTWAWQQSAPLECNCAWIWDWSWTWSVAAGGSDDTTAVTGASADPAGPAVVQRNDASAGAVATAEATIGQSISQDGASPQFAGQIVNVVQVATAQADAAQLAAGNSWWSTAPVDQANLVEATAAAAAQADLTQSAAQSGGPAPSAADVSSGLTPAQGQQAQWSGQQAEIFQNAAAVALGAQVDVANSAATGSSLAVDAMAGADVVSHQAVEQVIGDTGGRTQWVGQLVQIGQSADALAEGLQQGLAGSTFSRAASATSGAGAEASVLQDTAQKATGGGESSQTSAQLVIGLQDAIATAATAQPANAAIGADGVARASSEALAVNGALAAEATSQFVFGSGIQEATQNAFFDQLAVATSTSFGGTAGFAVVANCTTISQSAGQAFGAGLPGATVGDLSAYCAPDPTPTAGHAPHATVHAVAAPLDSPAPAGAPAADGEQFPHATRGPYTDAATTVTAATTLSDADSASTTHIFGASPDAAAPSEVVRVASIIVSSPPAPAEGALALHPVAGGGGKAGAEPPLPPVSGTPAGPGSVSPGTLGSGGIAAIMAALVISLLGAWRTWSESAVRRPTFFQGVLDTPG